MKMIAALTNTFMNYLYSNISQNVFDTKKEDLMQTSSGTCTTRHTVSSQGTFMMNIMLTIFLLCIIVHI